MSFSDLGDFDINIGTSSGFVDEGGFGVDLGDFVGGILGTGMDILAEKARSKLREKAGLNTQPQRAVAVSADLGSRESVLGIPGYEVVSEGGSKRAYLRWNPDKQIWESYKPGRRRKKLLTESDYTGLIQISGIFQALSPSQAKLMMPIIVKSIGR